METSLKLQETLIILPSPNTSTTSSSSSTTTSNGPHLPTTPPPQQQPITRPESNQPYPTTFVQAETSSFKQVVQMLTGSSDTAKRVDPHKNPIPPIKTNPKNNNINKSSKLYERRYSLKSFKISPLLPGVVSHPVPVKSPRMPRTPEILSPSMLNFPSLALSPVTPLILDPFNRSPPGSGAIDMEAENKAIGNKGFYLHPSPSITPRNGSAPRLLPLFPVTSPRLAAGSSNS